jgi:hypothetical protein
MPEHIFYDTICAHRAERDNSQILIPLTLHFTMVCRSRSFLRPCNLCLAIVSREVDKV